MNEAEYKRMMKDAGVKLSKAPQKPGSTTAVKGDPVAHYLKLILETLERIEQQRGN